MERMKVFNSPLFLTMTTFPCCRRGPGRGPAYLAARGGTCLHCAVQCSVVFSAVQCSAVQCSAVQFSAVHCSALQCSALQCAVQCTVCSAVVPPAVECAVVPRHLRPPVAVRGWQWQWQ